MTTGHGPRIDDESRFEELMRRLWVEHLPSFRSQVDQVAAFASDTVADPAPALAAAHRLAGSLGSYGLREGSVVAARLEACLSGPGSVDRDELGRLVQELRTLIDAFDAGA